MPRLIVLCLGRACCVTAGALRLPCWAPPTHHFLFLFHPFTRSLPACLPCLHLAASSTTSLTNMDPSDSSPQPMSGFVSPRLTPRSCNNIAPGTATRPSSQQLSAPAVPGGAQLAAAGREQAAAAAEAGAGDVTMPAGYAAAELSLGPTDLAAATGALLTALLPLASPRPLTRAAWPPVRSLPPCRHQLCPCPVTVALTALVTDWMLPAP
jgi:hypothetical protein